MNRVGLTLTVLAALLGLGGCAPASDAAAPGWWNDVVFYEIFVRSYADSDGNGIGDLPGLIERLDYLNDGDPATTDDLGVTGIWLMPINQSNSYHGYDVTDYRRVEPDYGTNEDFQRLIAEAHRRGMVVIIDLVMNHTSRDHPWFREARREGSAYDDWYIWSDSDPGYNGPWGQDVWYRSGDRYYYAVFWDGMPDLNLTNPRVTREMQDIARFWLRDMGADGFRLDGAKHLIERGQTQENTPETHAWLQDFRRAVKRADPDALILGEVWSPGYQVARYIGPELDLAFEFDLAGAMLSTVRYGNRTAIENAQRKVLDLYPPGQYAAFLTNHDQNRTFSQLHGDLNAARAAATLLLTNPGVPFIYYGEEIGMPGEKPDQRIRTPMQWDGTDRTAGFTSGRPWQPLADGYQERNVAAQDRDPGSLLNHYRALIHLRNDHPAMRRGEFLFVESTQSELYTFLRHEGDDVLLVIVNLSDEEVVDYALSLEAGPLERGATVRLLLGQGDPAPLEVSSAGGFAGYTPFPAIPPRASLILQIGP